MAQQRMPEAASATVGVAADAAATEAAPAIRSSQGTFSALRYPNFRLWFMGQLVSAVGTWMQISAQGFLVFQLTHSSAYLGFIGFVSGIPSLLLMLWGGVIADRVPRRRLLVVTQSSMAVLALILAALTFTGVVQPWHIVVLALGLGTANAFDAPAGQAIIVDLIDREELTNAIALNATLLNLATVIGPTVAGLTYAAVGGGWCFALNGISFLAMIIALLRMRLPQQSFIPRHHSALIQIREGLRYVITAPMLLTLMAVPLVAVLFSATYGTLLPALAVEVLHGNATTNGLLQSARGLGSLLGTLLLATFASRGWRGRWLTGGTIIYPSLLIILSLMHTLPLAMLALVGVGIGGSVLYSMANTLLQSHVPDALRGRVMSIYSMIMFGGIPLGALWSGEVAHFIGAPGTIFLSAVIALVFGAIFWVRSPQLRRLM